MTPTPFKVVLNAGAGAREAGDLHPGFSPSVWREVRLDVDPHAAPDVVASIADMRAAVADGKFDAVWSSHAIEHLYAHEVVPALGEVRRVLKPDGFALVTCPDLTAIAKLAASGDVESVVYNSPAGPIRALDMLFGHGRAIAEGRVAMAHRTGFTASRLARVGLAAGFAEVRVLEGPHFDLWALLLVEGCDVAALGRQFARTNIADLFGAEVAAANENQRRSATGF